MTHRPLSPDPATAAHAATCHVVTHVHWDREWYRPFEAFRARLAELAEQVCDELDDKRMASFHLDGQTIVLADIAAVRPDLAERLTAHARAGRLTVGPWHVLADNQLVSGENLIRNLLTARRVGADAALATVGYSPDAFGHPADLPRILRGFGMDTALVWRGAPPEHARFRWRSPDGSEVFAVNQSYHAAEVLWPSAESEEPARDDRMARFLSAERERLPGGPWLLMNGGDHLAPTGASARVAAARTQAEEAGTRLLESSLEDFFTAARETAGDELPLVRGELRAPGDRLTFLLPGTLSARTYLKQANATAQTLLERWAEPLVALHAAQDATLVAELRHAWELLLRNAPHDSICGCSVDEVHRENAVRFDRVNEVGEHVVARALAAAGLDTRLYGERPHDRAEIAVVNPHAAPHTGPVVVDILTAPDRYPVAVHDAAGERVPFESEAQGVETAFEADLDLLPDSRPSLRHRLRLLARDVPPLGHAVYTVTLADRQAADTLAHTQPGVRHFRTPYGHTVTAEDDASLSITLPDGSELGGVGRLMDGGDRGDTYNYDPPAQDRLVTPRLRGAELIVSPVRTTLRLTSELTVPRGLTEDRRARAAETTTMPLTTEITSWSDDPSQALRWEIQLDNTADDHRLRAHFPAAGAAGTWLADAHFSLIERPVTADLGPLPDAPGHEAVCGSAPVQSVAALGEGSARTAVAAPGLPEFRAMPAQHGEGNELVVTLLRSVGWLSRFDLTTRTTGAGPMLATPEAQCHGRQRFAFATAFGTPVADDMRLAAFGAATRAPLRAWQLRPGTTAPAERSGPAVSGALLTALKPAENGAGAVARLSNPTAHTVSATIDLKTATAEVIGLDESDDGRGTPVDRATELPPYGLLSLRFGS
ncbi:MULTISPECIES: hypothetical protein [unclassified Streptomyces]|uniref:glycoside hydrolase family 38 N-terminal domain-containing protein n=1 Tax=unclassified Streptomyces TaxID=2593676 RepID=UPI0035DDB085